ncbi:hypothetical protein [Reyranella sp.]|nr:hypothetical protein [Reyranella sp.]
MTAPTTKAESKSMPLRMTIVRVRATDFGSSIGIELATSTPRRR